MAKIIVYNVSSQALEVFYRGESDNMPYAYGNTMKVREFRGSSSSSVLWTTNATMESWNATRRSFNAPIPFRYAFKRIWEGGHGQQSQHYAGTALDCGQALSSSERNRLWRTANNLGVWSYVEPQSLTPTWVHVDKRYGSPACSAGYPTLRSGSRGVYVLVLQDALNAICQGHLRHGATLASALQLNGDHAIVAHIDERDIAAIGLKRGADKFEHCSYIGFFYHDSLLNCFDSSRLFG